MKAKSYLKQIELLDAKIDTRCEEIMRLKTLATRTTTALGGERVQTSGNQDKISECVAKIVELQNEMNDEIDKFVDLRREAKAIIEECCDPECMRLLYARYFEYKTWEQIAVNMNYTYQWVAGGLHQRALAQVQKGLDRKYE
jgi:hypothetical protein